MVSGDRKDGLTSREAREAPARCGANVIAPRYERPILLAWAIRIASDPMALLLAITAIIYTVLGDRVDAIVATVALLPIISVGIVLEGRADAALAKLRAMTAPRARVIRDGVERKISAETVVPGDLLVVGEGDVAAADGVLIDGRLSLDESALTGESVPIERVPAANEDAVAAGTTATGASTRYGRIARLLGTLTTPPTPIETVIRSMVARLGVVVAVVCVIVVLIERAHGTALPLALIAGVSLGMAAMPEELPMAYTLYLSLGAWRLSRDRALVRRLGSVETLGSTSTICVDKTGTITQGHIKLAEVVTFGDATRETVLEAGLLASEARATDPLDAAFARASERDPRANAQLIEEIPYDSRRRYAAKRWRIGGARVLAIKGAPDTLLGAAIVLPLLGLPLLLQPIHLVWLELVVHPTSSLVFESDRGDPELMRRPPRARGEANRPSELARRR